MTDSVNDILAYYQRTECGEDSRLARHQLERDITVRYFQSYLPGAGRVLEVGAGPGAYTAWLAQHGYEVTAVDLAPNLIDRCRRRIADLGLQDKVHCQVADARDLSAVPRREFDAVLLMGPLYHLVARENRLQAIGEAVSRLKPGGVFCSAFISRLGIMGNLLKAGPRWIEDQRGVRSVLDRGHDPDDTIMEGFHGYYATVDEVAPLHEQMGLETVLLAGAEPAISADDDSYNRLEGAQRELWLNLLYDLSREPSLVASSRHLLYIGRKPR